MQNYAQLKLAANERLSAMGPEEVQPLESSPPTTFGLPLLATKYLTSTAWSKLFSTSNVSPHILAFQKSTTQNCRLTFKIRSKRTNLRFFARVNFFSHYWKLNATIILFTRIVPQYFLRKTLTVMLLIDHLNYELPWKINAN